MNIYEQALELTRPPVTLENLQEYDALLSKAKGEEANRIGDLYTVLISQTDPEVYEQYVLLSMGEI
ncbi:hypothetical protein P3632_22115 [Vibrio parahaemolyticus]|uniref:Uncharacterized protein n=1 Tax=Vibrio parahaemolyticus TaxID=670 RepID=A0A7Y0SIB0_VIBPH|nr:hypothetical protein [Vibrio parahaemolyticus]MDF5045542.1 hypothetical protein [Vibrio parahaemolyticus]MDF5234446.1 hypothetical protein [Vibrio parahaemolyticus]MDF5243689.1 hypothetical protein [Vibrio parahaemolyticus]MDF5256965.1 hypothetical protein [Vibrio parahaemolyticus]MDF5276100.1 hypothetical protein [Vibrio parahaemolyticus]